jgi:hypothetical protein
LRRNGLLPASWAAEPEDGDDAGGEGEAALLGWAGDGVAVEDLCGRLSFYGALCAQLRAPVSRAALDAAWEATRGDEEAAALLLWLPSVLTQLTPEVTTTRPFSCLFCFLGTRRR